MNRLPDAVPMSEVRRALIVTLRHHGDVLLTSPVIGVLKRRAPSIEIDALVYSDTASMLSLHPGLAQLHVVDRRWKHSAIGSRIASEFRLLRQLMRRRYELLILLTDSWRGAWLARTLRPRWAVAPQRSNAGDRWRRSFTHLVSAPRGRPRHVAESNLDALRRIGIYPERNERDLILEPGNEARLRVRGMLAGHGLAQQRFVHVHPASRWTFKCWTPTGWQAIVRRLQSGGWPVVLTAAPDPAELRLIDAIQAGLTQPAISLAGQLDLKELAALTEAARLFVGVDSAPMHIAAAMRTPVVAIFGPSGESMWRPWGKPRVGAHAVVASTGYPCRPCGLDGCGGGKVSDCLESLGEDPVWQAVAAQLQMAAS